MMIHRLLCICKIIINVICMHLTALALNLQVILNVIEISRAFSEVILFSKSCIHSLSLGSVACMVSFTVLCKIRY